MDFNKLKIKDGKYWDVFLHEDQTVPGRLYFWYKDKTTLDLLDISEEAFIEFFNLGKEVRGALVKSFNPNMFNYLSLNNNTQHLHIHLIPRYESTVEFFGQEFVDTSYGKSYKRNPDFKISEEVMIKILEQIKSNI